MMNLRVDVGHSVRAAANSGLDALPESFKGLPAEPQPDLTSLIVPLL